MIIQTLMDVISLMVAGMLDLLPALPPEWFDALGAVTDFGSWAGTNLARFGILVPFETVGFVIQWWAAALLFWALMMGVRLILFIAGR
jgi:hypothetical protein